MTKPITVITGFLGAGKTTLLNRALQSPLFRRALVVVNELGDVPLDHLLVQEAREDVLLLASGCVCCSVRGDLVETLSRVATGQDAASFDRVFIETTGMADPTPVIATLVRHPMLAQHFHLDAIVTAVDGEQGAVTLARHPEAEKQVLLADDLIITKIDRAAPAQVEALRSTLARMNAQARVHLSTGGEVAWECLLPWTRATLQARLDPAAAHGHSHAHGAVRTFMVRVEDAVDHRVVALWLSMVSQFHGDSVLRFKGLVRVVEEAGPMVLQAVQHVVYPTYTMPRWPSEDTSSRVVVITRGMDEGLVTMLRESLEAAMRPVENGSAGN